MICNMYPTKFQMAVEMSGARRVASLDGLRGVAALMVMAFHFNLFFLPQAGFSTIVPFLNRAYLAVDLFFLLSGFVMAHVYGRQLAANREAHWRRFVLARFARLYPLFAIATLTLVVLVALYDAHEDGVSFSGRSLALEALMLQQWCSGLSWDYPSWSISTEAEAYIFFIFFAGILLAGKYPRLMVMCCILVLVGEGLGLLENWLGCTLPESQQEGGLSVGAVGPQGASRWRDYPPRSVRARSFAP